MGTLGVVTRLVGFWVVRWRWENREQAQARGREAKGFGEHERGVQLGEIERDKGMNWGLAVVPRRVPQSRASFAARLAWSVISGV